MHAEISFTICLVQYIIYEELPSLTTTIHYHEMLHYYHNCYYRQYLT